MFDLKELRRKAGIKPPEMAQYLGIALSTYFDKEAQRRRFQQDEIIKICTLFGVRVQDVKNFYSRDTRFEDEKTDQPKLNQHTA